MRKLIKNTPPLSFTHTQLSSITQFNALIIDEPELHLHPQFETFLLAEMRKIAGDPRTQTGAKLFFLITHSPYLLDFRTLDDLRECVVFHATEAPTYIGNLN
ncbi:MAG TPA: AAA family ATPase, partial [Pyrinomonadaceae bacterium]|nr:AAA family ATPase [Pyrinomonadaceae bacterium]